MKQEEFIKERNQIAMERNVSFWKREMNNEVLVEFNAEGDPTLEAVRTKGVVSKKYPPLYEDIPEMLRSFEKQIENSDIFQRWKILDDGLCIPIAWPELQFGNGMAGAIFGGDLKVISTEDHTYTFNEPVIRNWSEVYKLKFNKKNKWVLRILDAIKYFVNNGKKKFIVRPFFIFEGADFIVSMRGTTQAFYDLIDNSPELKILYDIGRITGIEFFEMKQKIVKKHNQKIIDNKKYADIAPIHSVPMLDMDAYALCSPEIFERTGFENKQKILNHFKGGSFYIHALGRHIIPIAAKLKNLTELWLFDDPKCPCYFEKREKWRKITNNIPLQMYCYLGEFIRALKEKSLPGGVRYNIFMTNERFNIDEINQIISEVKNYRTTELAANSGN